MCVEIIPTFIFHRGCILHNLFKLRIHCWDMYLQRIGKAKYESEVATCDGRRLEPGKTVLVTCEHKWQLY